MKQRDLSDAIRDYLTDCEKLRHLAKSTVQRYRVTLNQFARPLLEAEKWLQLEHVPPTAFRDFVVASDHLSNKTFNARRSHISAFLSWCYQEDLLSPADKHLAHLREKPNTTLRAKTYVNADQMDAVLEAAGRWHVRDKYFCAAMWASWRRSGELCAVQIRDLDLNAYPDSPHGRMVWHNQKAHRPNQVLDMSPQLQASLREWLAVYEDLAGEKPKPSWYLFPALRPEGLTVAGKRRRLVIEPEAPIGQPDQVARQAFKLAGIYQPGMACHAFRRGAATQLYDDMANAGHRNPLRLAMTALDHHSEQQTESYLDKDRDRRDLAMMLDQVYGEAAPEQQAHEVPASGGQVVELATWHESHTG
jgi:integrase